MEILQKSTLAKLLATENVSVEHQKVQTASFDLKNRKIILPIWNEMSNELYNLLIGHEVGHALNTPFEGWHDNVSNKGEGFKSFLNVIEDARIERMQKKQYPGLVKDFYAGYRELFVQDFFGVKDIDVQTLPLIDRINLHFKVGNMLGITFTDKEQTYVDKIATLETWEEVLEVAEELYGYSKEETAMQEMIEERFLAGDDEEDEQTKVNDGDEESDESGESEDESEGRGAQGEDENEDQSSDPGITEGIQDNTGPTSFTDVNYRKNENLLNNETARGNVYVNFPTKLKTKKYVMALDKVWDTNFENIFYADVPRSLADTETEQVNITHLGDALYKTFIQKNNSYINMLAQQFEMRRTASQLARSRIHKTGDLNMNKLWATRLTEDVFLSNTVVPNGKNHGMVMFIDFSGSMGSNMTATIEQLLIQISFCKKVNIPFDVYGFTAGDTISLGETKVNHGGLSDGDLMISPDSGLHVTHLISSSLSSSKFKTIFKKMLILGRVYVNRGWSNRGPLNTKDEYGIGYINSRSLAEHLKLGGTPLAETVLLARDIIADFKQKNRIEVMNVIFLTDGDATSDLEVYNGEGGNKYYSPLYKKDKIIIKEKSVTTVYKMTGNLSQFNWLKSVLKHMKNTLDIRLINFHIGNFDKRTLRMDCMLGYSSTFSESDFEAKYKKEWLANKFMEFENCSGYDVRYLIKDGNNLKVNVEEIEVKSEKKSDLIRGFKKFQQNKASNRVFLNKFIDKVA